MSGRVHAEAKAAPKSSFAPVRARLLADSRGKQLVSHPPLVQAKLTINQPNDRYEQEADRMAEQVLRMSEPGVQRQVEPEEEEEEETLQPKPLVSQITPLAQVQRQEEPEEDEETLQPKPLAKQISPLVQREVEPEEEEPVHAKLADGAHVQRQEEEPEKEEPIQAKQAGGQTPRVGPSLAAQIQSVRGSGPPLPRSVRSFFEPRFGYDFSQVRIHTDARAAASAVNARAFTVGRDVVFGAGQYVPGTVEGKHLIAHELTHVVQQSVAGERRSRESSEEGNPATIMPYRGKNSPNFGANDSSSMKEKQYRGKKGYPIIKLIYVNFDSVKTINSESVPSGTLTASYMNIRGAIKPPSFSTPVVGGYPSQGLSDTVTNVTPVGIKGWGYNRSTVPKSQRSSKDSHYYKPAHAASANMSWAIYFKNKQAVHYGSLSAGSLACVHVGSESTMRKLNYHTLAYGKGTKMTVRYTQGALKKPCCERYDATGKMVSNPCRGQDPKRC